MWGLLIPLGIIVLGVIIAWAMLNNRRTRSEEQRGEQATREFYREVDAADKAEGR